MATNPLLHGPKLAPIVVPAEKLKKYPRERDVSALGGVYGEDDEPDNDPFDKGIAACYSRPEELAYSDTVDWDIVFERAGIPEWYRPAWRRYVDREKRRDIPEGHYRWILRACRSDPWRSRLRKAIEEQRAVDPEFGVPRATWNNRDELHRTLYHAGWQPVAQGSVSTQCRPVSVSSTTYWKADDRPGPLTRSKKNRSVQHVIVGCDGFRANFQGAALEGYRESLESGLRYGPSAVLHEYDIEDRTQFRNFCRMPSVGLRKPRAAGEEVGTDPAEARYQRKGYPLPVKSPGWKNRPVSTVTREQFCGADPTEPWDNWLVALADANGLAIRGALRERDAAARWWRYYPRARLTPSPNPTI